MTGPRPDLTWPSHDLVWLPDLTQVKVQVLSLRFPSCRMGMGLVGKIAAGTSKV